MSGTPGSPFRHADRPSFRGIDTTVPHPARVWNYWLGGEDNFAADRAVGDQVRDESPAVVDNAQAFRRFLERVVRYMTEEVGLRQFLDVGAGLPTVDSTHEVAQRIAPECRVVYVDNDPVAVAHARELLVSAPEGTTAYVAGDVHDTASILCAARETIEFDQPVGLILCGILGHVEHTAARSIVRRLMYELVPGSHLVVCDGADTGDALYDSLQRQHNMLNRGGWVRYHPRSPEKIAAFFEGLDLVDPGVVPCLEWRSEPGTFSSPGERHAVGGLARKK